MHTTDWKVTTSRRCQEAELQAKHETTRQQCPGLGSVVAVAVAVAVAVKAG